jgi:hypothetical protein
MNHVADEAGDARALEPCPLVSRAGGLQPRGRMETQPGELAARFDRSGADARALRRDLPGIIAETLRGAAGT